MGSRQAGHSVLFHRGSSRRRWSHPGPRGERWYLAGRPRLCRCPRLETGGVDPGGGAGSKQFCRGSWNWSLRGRRRWGGGVPCEYCWPRGQQVQPCTALPVLLQVVVLLGRFAWVPGNRYLPRTVEDAGILPNKATPDLRASPCRDQPLPGSAWGRPAAPRRSWKQSLHVSLGKGPCSPTLTPTTRPALLRAPSRPLLLGGDGSGLSWPRLLGALSHRCALARGGRNPSVREAGSPSGAL